MSAMLSSRLLRTDSSTVISRVTSLNTLDTDTCIRHEDDGKIHPKSKTFIFLGLLRCLTQWHNVILLPPGSGVSWTWRCWPGCPAQSLLETFWPQVWWLLVEENTLITTIHNLLFTNCNQTVVAVSKTCLKVLRITGHMHIQHWKLTKASNFLFCWKNRSGRSCYSLCVAFYHCCLPLRHLFIQTLFDCQISVFFFSFGQYQVMYLSRHFQSTQELC